MWPYIRSEWKSWSADGGWFWETGTLIAPKAQILRKAERNLLLRLKLKVKPEGKHWFQPRDSDSIGPGCIKILYLPGDTNRHPGLKNPGKDSWDNTHPSKVFSEFAGDPILIPGSGRYPGERGRNPLQYSCLENSMDRGAWWATVHGVAKSQTRLSDQHFICNGNFN